MTMDEQLQAVLKQLEEVTSAVIALAGDNAKLFERVHNLERSIPTLISDAVKANNKLHNALIKDSRDSLSFLLGRLNEVKQSKSFMNATKEVN